MYGWALVLLFLLLVAGVAAWAHRPHLKHAPPRGTLVKAFAAERETMLLRLLDKYGLTTEFEGYLVRHTWLRSGFSFETVRGVSAVLACSSCCPPPLSLSA